MASNRSGHGSALDSFSGESRLMSMLEWLLQSSDHSDVIFETALAAEFLLVTN